MKKLTYILGLSVGLLLTQGCSKLEYTPTASVLSESAINNEESADVAILGIYNELQDADLAFDGFIALAGLYSDELDFTGTFPTRLEADQYNINPSNTTAAAVYADFYDAINVANNVIERIALAEDQSLTPELKKSFEGEARALRALCYMYLVSYWGDVPLVLTATTVADESIQVPKVAASEVWAKIIDDLLFAESNIVAAGGGSRAGSETATALLARAYLNTGDYPNALIKAEAVIGKMNFSLEPNYSDIFKARNSSENIFYLDFTATDANSNAFFFFSSAAGGRLSASPSAALIAAYEANDTRYAASIDQVEEYGIKYSDIAQRTDPVYLMRYAEILLIAAEASAEAGLYMPASDYLNEVRNRAGLGDLSLDANNYVELILAERFVELAMEGPFRLVDVRRRGKTVEFFEAGGFEAPCDNFWPLPQRDIDRNPNLEQNSCY